MSALKQVTSETQEMLMFQTSDFERHQPGIISTPPQFEEIVERPLFAESDERTVRGSKALTAAYAELYCPEDYNPYAKTEGSRTLPEIDQQVLARLALEKTAQPEIETDEKVLDLIVDTDGNLRFNTAESGVIGDDTRSWKPTFEDTDDTVA